MSPARGLAARRAWPSDAAGVHRGRRNSGCRPGRPGPRTFATGGEHQVRAAAL